MKESYHKAKESYHKGMKTGKEWYAKAKKCLGK